MRIGFDVSQTAEQMTGCGIFASELLMALVEEAPQHSFLPYPIFSQYRHPDFRNGCRPRTVNVDPVHEGLSWEALNAGWDRQTGLDEFLGRPDLVHSNSFGCPRHLSAPLVYTVYDLSPLDHPEFHTEENRLVCFGGLFAASLRAARFVAISEFTRARLLHWFPHIGLDAVSVVYPGARFDRPRYEALAPVVLQRYGLRPEGFWLAVGTIEPRKNYRVLLEAYARLTATRPDSPVLFIAGQAGWDTTRLEERIENLGLSERVIWPGFVPDDDLAVLYAHALALVYTSHYEGFGLPLVEALSCGTPVIAARTSSIPEILGDAGELAAPDDPAAFAAAMRRVLDEPSLRMRLKDTGSKRARRFSWREAARRTVDGYAQVLTRSENPPSFTA